MNFKAGLKAQRVFQVIQIKKCSISKQRFLLRWMRCCCLPQDLGAFPFSLLFPNSSVAFSWLRWLAERLMTLHLNSRAPGVVLSAPMVLCLLQKGCKHSEAKGASNHSWQPMPGLIEGSENNRLCLPTRFPPILPRKGCWNLQRRANKSKAARRFNLSSCVLIS